MPDRDRNTNTPPANPNAPDREGELRAPTQPLPTADPRHDQPQPGNPDVSIGTGPGTRENDRRKTTP